MSEDTQFEMIYCDTAWCRVNTFERGVTSACPGCHAQGMVIQ